MSPNSTSEKQRRVGISGISYIAPLIHVRGLTADSGCVGPQDATVERYSQLRLVPTLKYLVCQTRKRALDNVVPAVSARHQGQALMKLAQNLPT